MGSYPHDVATFLMGSAFFACHLITPIVSNADPCPSQFPTIGVSPGLPYGIVRVVPFDFRR